MTLPVRRDEFFDVEGEVRFGRVLMAEESSLFSCFINCFITLDAYVCEYPYECDGSVSFS